MLERKYDKGEKRHKHEWGKKTPGIVFENKRPKMWVGKCPAGMPDSTRVDLLKEAIAAPRGDRDISYPKYLYVVHEGAIYEARTSDCGVSYHGYPYHGKLTKSLVNQLRAMAVQKNCLDAFEVWVKEHLLR